MRVSPEIEAEVSKQIDEMLENGIIRPSSSSWASRVILVKKKDGTHRFAVDFRDLNDVTKRDAYPMSDPRDVFDRMGGATVFSTLDGASAYWSVPVKEKHREFTAFVSTRGQFEFNRMPFGLSNSQATYQRAVDKALRGCPNVQAFVDDACVHYPSFDTHLEHLDEPQLVILKIEDEECEDWAFECTDCCIDGKEMLRCILMTSSNCLLNNKAKNITSTTSCPKDTQRKILKLTSN